MTTMRAMINKWIVRILLLTGPVTWSQQVLDLDAFLGYVKAYHPYLKQADIKLSESQVKLLKSRGAFDPKFGFDQKTKTFKGTSYYDKQNASISIPTYFGLAIQAGVQQTEGDFLNPENQLSGDRLYGVGASLQLGRGLLANPRQTALKQAKLFTQQAREKNALMRQWLTWIGLRPIEYLRFMINLLPMPLFDLKALRKECLRVIWQSLIQ